MGRPTASQPSSPILRRERPLRGSQFSTVNDKSWPVVADDDPIPGIEPLQPVVKGRLEATENRKLYQERALVPPPNREFNCL
jgi:hypothetical protein